MESAQSFGNYNLAFSLADLIDNSITAGATDISIVDNYDEQEIRVVDNGCGMTEDELVTNMRMGSRNPNSENKKEDLGRFGLGLKTASFAQARCLTVVSKRDGIFSAARWDLDNVTDWKMYLFDNDDARKLASNTFPDGNGTEIIWTKLNRLLEDGSIGFDDFNAMMADAESELSLVFHRYLSGELEPKRKKLTITRNGRKLIPFDPFCRANDSTHQKDEETLEIERGNQKTKIYIKPFILPHFSNLTPSEDKMLGGREGYIKNQGFYVYREHRLIIRGTWFKLVPHGEFSNRARVRVDIPSSLDIGWKISVDKSEAELPWDLRLRLKNLLATWVLPDAISVYVKRKPKTIEKLRPVWSRHSASGGVWHFSINQLHPLLDSFRGRLRALDKESENSGFSSHFNDIVKLIEKCLPLSSIQSEMEKKPQTVNAGYTNSTEILDSALALRAHLVSAGHTEQYVIDTLKNTVPYDEHFKQIQEKFRANPIKK